MAPKQPLNETLTVIVGGGWGKTRLLTVKIELTGLRAAK